MNRCPHCGEDRQIEQTDRYGSAYFYPDKPNAVILQTHYAIWFCNVCGREFKVPKDAKRK